MSSTGYDLSTSTYSPEGRVYQIEYAQKACDISGSSLAITCKDGVVLACEKQMISPMLVPGSRKAIFAVTLGASLAFSGVHADGKELAEIARSEAAKYKEIYAEEIPTRILAERVAMYMHAYTQYWSVRPFGAAVFIGGFRSKQAELFGIDVSGKVTKYYGYALGKGRQSAKNEIEKIDFSSVTTKEAVYLAVKTLMKVHDENDKEFEIEVHVIQETFGKEISKSEISILQEKAKQEISFEQE